MTKRQYCNGFHRGGVRRPSENLQKAETAFPGRREGAGRTEGLTRTPEIWILLAPPLSPSLGPALTLATQSRSRPHSWSSLCPHSTVLLLPEPRHVHAWPTARAGSSLPLQCIRPRSARKAQRQPRATADTEKAPSSKGALRPAPFRALSFRQNLCGCSWHPGDTSHTSTVGKVAKSITHLAQAKKPQTGKRLHCRRQDRSLCSC